MGNGLGGHPSSTGAGRRAASRASSPGKIAAAAPERGIVQMRRGCGRSSDPTGVLGGSSTTRTGIRTVRTDISKTRTDRQ